MILVNVLSQIKKRRTVRRPIGKDCLDLSSVRSREPFDFLPGCTDKSNLDIAAGDKYHLTMIGAPNVIASLDDMVGFVVEVNLSQRAIFQI